MVQNVVLKASALDVAWANLFKQKSRHTGFVKSFSWLSSASGNNLKGDGKFKNIDENALF